MHPAKSVILFTVASGAGYGLIFLFTLFDMLGYVPRTPAATAMVFGLSLVLITGGLLASTFHLGHPERAWRALTQWRSSWLSREGVAALATYAPLVVYGFLRWQNPDVLSLAEQVAGGLTLVGAVVTVYCTSMIYASLKTIPAWATAWTPASYLAMALVTGSVLLCALAYMGGYFTNMIQWVTMILLVFGALVKLGYRRAVMRQRIVSTAETATGLAKEGETAHLLEAPHTEGNYLTEEMGGRLDRNAAGRLVRMSMMAGFLYPLLLVFFASSQSLWINDVIFVVAILTTGVGIAMERWLFFAEARHSVTLYYGERAV